MAVLHQLRSYRIGLALSGGSVRGLAHIGVIKALVEADLTPAVVTGSSAGSLIGAFIASGVSWKELARIAHNTFWPRLLHGESLHRFCSRNLPATFSDLKVPFAAIATELPGRQARIIDHGELASAITASCAMRVICRPVIREGKLLKDGGIACVLPSEACRALGADFVIGSDVWEIGFILRCAGLHPEHPRAERTYPASYYRAVRNTDVLIHPDIPLSGYLPNRLAVERMISAGETATRLALSRIAL